MLSKGFKVVAPKTFEIYYEDVAIKENEALVKIEMGAICKADLRYYLGQREERILGLKYPMRLLHEVVGTILKDPTGTLKVGGKVVLVPNVSEATKDHHEKWRFRQDLGENYCPKAKFASSNMDGFSCEYISFPISNIVPVKNEVASEKAVFAELTSVAFAAIRRCSDLNNKVIGVWGDGVVGYILTSVLKTLTNSKVISIGKTPDKLNKFPADKTFLTQDKKIKSEGIEVAFECVGGKASQYALSEIIDTIDIGGNIVLTGVSETSIEINTRKILEKGITLTGSTRSSIEDFKKAVELIESTKYNEYLDTLIKDVVKVNGISDYYNVFEYEAKNHSLGKNILKFQF